jgi:hypothetical protein
VGSVRSGCLWRGKTLLADVHAQGVDTERAGDHVQQLSPGEGFEVGVAGRDLANVLGPAELALLVFVVAGNRPVTIPPPEVFGEPVAAHCA